MALFLIFILLFGIIKENIYYFFSMWELNIHDNSLEIANKRELLIPHLEDWRFQISLQYKSDFKSAKILRDYIEEICFILWIKDIWKSRLILITDELNNNAIEYGSKNGDINTMRITAHVKPRSTYINIEVEDSGMWEFHKNSTEMKRIRRRRKKDGFSNHHSIRGRGLFMIITPLVDKLYFDDSEKGGLIVWIEKKIKL